MKLNSEGRVLVYSALVGQDFREMYVDAARNVYLTGSTWDQPKQGSRGQAERGRD